jgi:hypothetical protein
MDAETAVTRGPQEPKVLGAGCLGGPQVCAVLMSFVVRAQLAENEALVSEVILRVIGPSWHIAEGGQRFANG